ncbi:MAG: Gx transporter family protein [Clostridia bacterium]|nr:Gx transporter family protein [Clostridia bacterium]
MKKRLSTKKVAFLGLSASLALLLSWIEFLLPPLYAAVPGIKIGLPNVVILVVLYLVGTKEAAAVSLVRLCVSSLLFGNPVMFVYSAAGAVLSLLLMILLKKLDRLSTVGVSVAGGVAHNIGQTVVAMLLLDTPQIAYYLIVLTVTGTISGIFIGLCGAFLTKRLSKTKFFHVNK